MLEWLKKQLRPKAGRQSTMTIDSKPCKSCGKPIYFNPLQKPIPEYCNECQSLFHDVQKYIDETYEKNPLEDTLAPGTEPFSNETRGQAGDTELTESVQEEDTAVSYGEGHVFSAPSADDSGWDWDGFSGRPKDSLWAESEEMASAPKAEEQPSRKDESGWNEVLPKSPKPAEREEMHAASERELESSKPAEREDMRAATNWDVESPRTARREEMRAAPDWEVESPRPARHDEMHTAPDWEVELPRPARREEMRATPKGKPGSPRFAGREETRAESSRKSLKLGVPDWEELLRRTDEGFSEALLRMIDEKGMTDAECYKKANVDRKLFSKIRSNPAYRPSKPTVFAFIVAMELTMPEAEELLYKAGFALSHSSKYDIVLEYFIKNRSFDIHEINQVLYRFDMPLLGSGMN